MRRYFRFSLRTLFVLTALAALGVWQIPPAVERYRREQWVLNRVKSYEAHLRNSFDAKTAREKAEEYEIRIRMAEFEKTLRAGR
jgi:cytochrome oxidase assembly protein ShyY1